MLVLFLVATECTTAGTLEPEVRVLRSILYSKELPMTRNDGLESLEAADMLLLDAAVGECPAHRRLSEDPDNCGCLPTVALRYPNPYFKEAVVITVNHHFHLAGKRCDPFMDLSVAILQELLSSDELNVRHEDLQHAIYRCYT
ncbi:kelch-like protein 10 [Haemaphysalis longicornis]